MKTRKLTKRALALQYAAPLTLSVLATDAFIKVGSFTLEAICCMAIGYALHLLFRKI